MEAIGWVVSYVAFIVGGTLLRGWVLSVLWGWFMVTTFHLPRLSIPAALGLSVVVSYLTWQIIDVESPKRSRTDQLIYSFGSPIVGALIVLGMGFIVHLFM